MTEFQQLVDGLAMRLKRAVAIDDREVRLVAYSSHEGVAVDPLRQYSILNRRVPLEVVQYVHKHALNSSAPVRLPPAPDLGMNLARICVPICQGDTVLGWLSLLENDDPLSQRDLDVAMEAAQAAAVLFQRSQLGDELSRSRIRELVPRLIGDDEHDQRRAAEALVESDLFAAGEPVVALVIRPYPDGRTLRDAERTAVESALDRIGRRLTARRYLHAVRPDHGVFIVAAKDLRIVGGGVTAIAGWLADAVDRELAAETTETSTYIGIGETAGCLEDAARSYRQAVLAAQVARVVGGMGRAAAYADLGIYTLLARIPRHDLAGDAVPAMARRLLDLDDRGRVLLGTVEAFLDHAGNVKATADALNVHRATLYYRLGRVEQVTGASLDDGEDRLTLHLGLKMARVAGLLT
jgi:PucR C-terminal helix-turn-helix domain/GGDEF-like domain